VSWNAAMPMVKKMKIFKDAVIGSLTKSECMCTYIVICVLFTEDFVSII
jgi:hypothetical protein